MQTMEAILSLMFLVLIAGTFVFDRGAELDTSLQTQHISNDLWRVLYLRGDFHGIEGNVSTLSLSGQAHADMDELAEQTGFCVFIAGIRATSCIPGEATMEIYKTRKTLVVGGVPEDVSFTVALRAGDAPLP